MSKVGLLSTVAVVASVVVATYFGLNLRNEHDLNAKLRDRVSQLEHLQSRPVDVVPQSQASNRPVAIAPSPSAPRVVASGLPGTSSAKGANHRELLKDPEYREERLKQLRRILPSQYPDLDKELGLTPQQTAAVLDLFAQQRLNITIHSVDVGATEEMQHEAQQNAQKDARWLQSSLEAELGPSGYQRFKEYQQTIPFRVQVAELQTTLSSTEFPLSDEQKAGMLAGLTDGLDTAGSFAPSSAPRTFTEAIQASQKARDDRNRRTLEVAQRYLSSQQLAALRTSLEQRSPESRTQ